MTWLGILAGELLAEATRCARDEDTRFVLRLPFLPLQGGRPVTNAVLSEKVVCAGLFDNDVCICTSRRSFLGLLFQAYSGYLFRASAAVSRSERMADQRFSPRVLTAAR